MTERTKKIIAWGVMCTVFSPITLVLTVFVLVDLLYEWAVKQIFPGD